MAQEKILLSACLAGVRCVYDGSHNRHPAFARIHREKKAILFCPEVLGGLTIPKTQRQKSNSEIQEPVVRMRFDP